VLPETAKKQNALKTCVTLNHSTSLSNIKPQGLAKPYNSSGRLDNSSSNQTKTYSTSLANATNKTFHKCQNRNPEPAKAQTPFYTGNQPDPHTMQDQVSPAHENLHKTKSETDFCTQLPRL
jgi:hypothetical protein